MNPHESVYGQAGQTEWIRVMSLVRCSIVYMTDGYNAMLYPFIFINESYNRLLPNITMRTKPNPANP